MKLRSLSFLLGFLLMQCAVLTQAQDLLFSKVFQSSSWEGMHVLASAEAGQDSLMMITTQGELNESGAVHLMDATGVMHWSKSFVKENNWVEPIDIVRTADQNFLICATETNFNSGKNAVLLIKLDATGELLWVKKFEHEVSVLPSGIALSAGGDILITGRAMLSYYPLKSKLLLIRIESDGAILWSKTYETATLRDEGLAVAELAGGQLMVGGLTKGSGEYNEELSLTQTDASGNVLWAKRMISTGYYPYSKINDLIAGPSGFYLYGSAYNPSAMVMAVDVVGETIWSKSFSAVASSWDESEYRGRINTTISGDLLLSFGSNYNSGTICQFSADGNPVWMQYVAMQPMEAKPLSDGGYLFLGNGPMMGVKTMGYSQTGVYRTNALGEGVGCTEQGYFDADDYVPVFENITYSFTDIGSVSDYALQWGEFSLEFRSGCVDFYGAVEGTPDVANALNIYPNPGNGPFRLQLEDMQPESVVQLTVVNSMGQNIFSREGEWSQIQMIDRKLPAGIYLINVKTLKNVFTTRLIVR